MKNESDASHYAQDLHKEIGWSEYGIYYLEFDRPLLDKTAEEATDWLDEYFEKCRQEEEEPVHLRLVKK